MKKIMSAMLLSVILLSASQLPAIAMNDWTVLCYLVSEDKKSTALYESHIKALNSILSIASKPGTYEILTQIDPPAGSEFASWAKVPDGAFRLRAGKGKWNATEMGELNMGSPYTLWEFLKWGVAVAPAKKYALIIAGHGSGIFSWHGTGNVSDEIPGEVHFHPDRFVAYDSTDKDCLTIFELQAVLRAFRERLNDSRKLDLITFDSCLPGSLEALYQLRNEVSVIAASPHTTIVGSMPYKTLTSVLAKNSGISAEDFACKIAEGSVKNTSSDAVFGVFLSSKVQEIVSTLDKFSIELIAARQSAKFSVKNLVHYWDSESKYYWDLGKILESFSKGHSDLSSVPNAQTLKLMAAEARQLLSQSNVTTWFSGKFSDNKVAGLSIAWPDKDDYKSFRKFYKVLELSDACHWDEFLDVFYSME